MPKKLHLITAIVQARVGNQVIEAALKAGATGATYFHALGTGVRQKLGLSGEDIEVDKRVITIVTDTSRSDSVLAAVTAAGQLDQPGQGFAYVQEVLKAVGFIPPAQ